MKVGSTNPLVRWGGAGLFALALATAAHAQPNTNRTGSSPTTGGTSKTGSSSPSTTGGMNKTGSQPPTSTGTGDTGTGAAGIAGLFMPTLLTADELTQLMTDAETLADDLFGLLGFTPTDEERAALTELFFQLLFVLTFVQKLGALMSPGSP
ncbi:MAG: hypothetical protein J0I06_20645 [Planctomycetes bacterium]|nr:hypothetical protein [Planctomycetota bacterium]